MTPEQAVDMFINDSAIAHNIIHGGPTNTVPTEGGPVPTFAKVLADAEAMLITGQNSLLAQVQAVVDQAVKLDDNATEATSTWSSTKIAAMLAAKASLNAAVTFTEVRAQRAILSQSTPSNPLTVGVWPQGIAVYDMASDGWAPTTLSAMLHVAFDSAKNRAFQLTVGDNNRTYVRRLHTALTEPPWSEVWTSTSFNPASKSDVGHKHVLADITNAGTAAGGTLTTSDLDTTAGRVLRVGNMGIGRAASPLFVFATVGDWAKPAGWTGFVNMTGSVNTPLGITVGYLYYQVVGKRDNSNGYGAMAIMMDTNRVFIGQAKTNSEAPAWVELIHSGNFDPAAKQDLIPVGNTTDYFRGDKTWAALDKAAVGLPNVDNTSDAAKPVSTAQQTALNAKANLASPAFTGTPTVPTAANGTNTTQAASTAYVVAYAPSRTGAGASGSWAIGITGNAATASKWSVARSITLAGDLSGTVALDGSANVTLTATLPADVKNPPIANVTGLQAALDAKVNAEGLTTDAVAEGSGLYFTAARVLSTALAGLSTATNAAISATDSVLSAFGKLQAQITAAFTAIGGKQDTIPTGTTSQFYRGDKTWQAVTKANVGLGSVDNTSDAAKPVSTAQATAIAAKVDKTQSVIAGNGLTGGGALSGDVTVTLGTPLTVTNSTTNSVTATGHTHSLTVTKGDVGLGNVDNTSDAAKPVSTATQTALNGKEDALGTAGTNQFLRGDKTWSGVTKAQVGLGNVDNVPAADLRDRSTHTGTQPISSVANLQAELDSKLSGATVAGRNLFVNGALDIWQRGTSLAMNGGRYVADMVKVTNVGASGTISRQTFTYGHTDAPGNPRYYQRVSVTSPGSATGNYTMVRFIVEGSDTFAGKNVTISLSIRSSAARSIAFELETAHTATVGAQLKPADGLPRRTLAANTWTRQQATFAVPATAGATPTAGNSCSFNVWINWGSNFLSRVTGATQQIAGSVDIASIKIEEGAVATEFQTADPSIDAARCSRYCTTVGLMIDGVGPYTAGRSAISLPVPMAVVPLASVKQVYQQNSAGILSFAYRDNAVVVATLTTTGADLLYDATLLVEGNLFG